ncbi:hypothetical protein SAMN05444405_101232 [Bacteroides luti]|jgi:hypothetical protein|uniref:Uncharacterized protein n=1 Tax=Bacteroides luti TaxID=1297750 RepID=A0A1M4SYL3_9BACE|nr:hypothetical protein SAMN05444405_101232 [Bacteroides luti]
MEENSINIIVGIINIIPIIVFVIFPLLRKDQCENSIFSRNPLILFIEGLIFSFFFFVLCLYMEQFFPSNVRDRWLLMIFSEIILFPIAAIVLFLVCLGCNIAWTKHYWYWATIILLFMLFFLFYLFIVASTGI